MTRLRTGRLGFDSRQGGLFSLFFTALSQVLGPIHTPIQWAPGALSPGVKRPEREAYHSSPSNAVVKNAWSYTSTPPYVLMT